MATKKGDVVSSTANTPIAAPISTAEAPIEIGREPAPANPEPKFQVKWEVNFSVVLSLISLLIAASVAAYSLAGWLQGAQVTAFPPELVSFRCTSAASVPGLPDTLECKDDSSLFLVATNMTYWNKGQPSYGAVVLSEEATVTIDQKSHKLNWQYFSSLTTSNNSSVNAGAVLVPGSSALAHETQFWPRDDACQNPCNTRAAFYPWKDFVAAMSTPNTPVSITFKTTILRPDVVEIKQHCDVLFQDKDRDQFRALGMRMTRLTSLTCRASS